MEHLLNLLWLMVVSILCITAVIADRRGMLRCSLPVALGATALLAIVLFPALSMTDDLQRARLETETSTGHLSSGSLMGSREDSPVAMVALLPFLLLLILFASRLLTLELLSRRGQSPRLPWLIGLRTEAPRPPPAPALA